MLKQFYKVTLGLLIGFIASVNLLALTPRQTKHVASLQMQAKDIKAAVKTLEKRPSAFNDPQSLQALVDGIAAMEEEICWVKDNCDRSAKARRVVDQACDVQAYYNDVVSNPRVQELAQDLGVDLGVGSNGSLLKQALVGVAVCGVVFGGGYLAWNKWQEHDAQPQIEPTVPSKKPVVAPACYVPVGLVPVMGPVAPTAPWSDKCIKKYYKLAAMLRKLHLIYGQAVLSQQKLRDFQSSDWSKYRQAITDLKSLQSYAQRLNHSSKRSLSKPTFSRIVSHCHECSNWAMFYNDYATDRLKKCEEYLKKERTFFDRIMHH